MRSGVATCLICMDASFTRMDADLRRYVKRALRNGYSEERIVHELKKQGWKASTARDAIRRVKADGSHQGVIVVSILFLIVVAGVGLAVWVLLPASPMEDPDPSDEMNVSQGSGNESEVNESATSVISECERRDSRQDKFFCYQSRFDDNLTSVDCRLLPQPDRRLCTHAYEQAATR